MGPVGWQEMAVIFLVALVLFGPKKLPELGRTLGKAITEFRRASNDLKATFEREMHSLERENESLKEVTQSYTKDAYNFYDSPYDDSGAYGSESYDSTATHPSTVGASATQDAESPVSEASGQDTPAVNGTVPRTPGTELASVPEQIPEEAAAPAESQAPASTATDVHKS